MKPTSDAGDAVPGIRTGTHRLPLAGMVAALWTVAVLVKGIVRPGGFGGDAGWVVLLLNSTPSLIGGLSVPLCFLIAHPRPDRAAVLYACMAAVVVLTVAEGIELRGSRSTFDTWDLAASFAGVLIAGSVCAAWASDRQG